MTSTTEQTPPLRRIARFLGDNPMIPLVVLLLVLVGLLEFMRPGIVNERWVGNTIKFAIPLAMLAACQTLTMLTGGIDLSASVAATITAFVMATQVPIVGVPLAILIGLIPAVLIGLANGFGVAVCRVHPLIMTLGTGLIGTGCLQVYQRFVIATGSVVPDGLAWLGTGRTWDAPNSLLLFVPFAALIVWGQRRTGFGRLLYALGSNEKAARISGVRSWQVFLALYVLSGLIAGGGRVALCGADQGPIAVAGEPAAVAVGCGGGNRRHLDLRWARGLWRHHSGRADPDCAGHAADPAANARGRAAHPVRSDHSGGYHGLHPPDRPKLRRHDNG